MPIILQRPPRTIQVYNFMCDVFSPADSKNYHLGSLPVAPVTNQGFNKIYINRPGKVTKISMMVVTNGAGSSETSSVFFRKNATTNTLISSAVDNSGPTSLDINDVSLDVDMAVGDYFEIRWETPAWVTNPSNVSLFGSVIVE